MLPDLTGIEVLKILRAEAASKEIPVILLTARAEVVDRLVGFELGADDYVTKPFSVREIVLRVRAVLLSEVWGYDSEVMSRTWTRTCAA